MPMRPPHLCACGRIVPAGERCACQLKRDAERKARFDRVRPTARERGYDSAWDKARADFLLKHPFCNLCAKSGIRTPATVVDHIVPHKGDRTLFWDRTNWQPLCTRCHSRDKQRAERRVTP